MNHNYQQVQCKINDVALILSGKLKYLMIMPPQGRLPPVHHQMIPRSSTDDKLLRILVLQTSSGNHVACKPSLRPDLYHRANLDEVHGLKVRTCLQIDHNHV